MDLWLKCFKEFCKTSWHMQYDVTRHPFIYNTAYYKLCAMWDCKVCTMWDCKLCTMWDCAPWEAANCAPCETVHHVRLQLVHHVRLQTVHPLILHISNHATLERVPAIPMMRKTSSQVWNFRYWELTSTQSKHVDYRHEWKSLINSHQRKDDLVWQGFH